MLVPAVALLLAAGILQGCALMGFGPLAPVPDSQMTAEDFDDTIAFEPGADADEAAPPLDVHEVDEAKVTAAGGKKVVDGSNWLGADDHERNDILNLVEEVMPADSILVIVVATGDIWQIPLGAGQQLPDGVRPWTDDEYYELDEYDDEPRIPVGQLTITGFVRATDVANAGEFGEISYVHGFGETGYREIQSRKGFQVALANTWLRETPVQRYMRMVMLRNYFSRLPQFQGAGNQLVFGAMVPDGGLYVMPYNAYRNLLGQGGVRPWTLYEIAMLPTVLTIYDRSIRNEYERIILERVDIP
jgi:hypothetical protein